MDPIKKKQFLASLWSGLQDLALEYLHGPLAKKLITKLLSSGAAGGFQTWLVTTLVKEVIVDEAAEPIVKAAFVEAGFLWDRKDGKIYVTKLKGAQDAQSYNDAADSVMS